MSHIDPSSRSVVITGVGFRACAGGSGDTNLFDGVDKPNIGAAVALAAAQSGYTVIPVSRTAAKLDRICASIKSLVPGARVSPRVVDLLSEGEARQFEASLSSDCEVDIVHCAGLSAGTYALPNDNPYLRLEDTPLDLPALEFEAVVKTLLIAVRTFIARWKRQKRTRVVVVSSMSGIRPFPLGYSHSSAKGALTQATRALTLELNPLGIHICEVQPGMVDTGLYDAPAVDAAVRQIGLTFGYKYESGKLPQMQPSSVAEAVMLCLTSESHVLRISLVSEGQFPHLGA